MTTHPFARACLIALLPMAASCSVVNYLFPTLAPPPSRFHVGDYVVYRFTGDYTPEPVTLRKQVIGKEDNFVTFEVLATRGSDKRHWVELVEDIPEKRKKRVVEEVDEVIGTERRKLLNVDNDDLLRLYSWTELAHENSPRDEDSSKGDVDVAGSSYSCDLHGGLVSWHDQTVRFHIYDCPNFLWRVGGTAYWNDRFGDTVLRSEVVEYGNVNDHPASTPPSPATPPPSSAPAPSAAPTHS